MDDVVGSERERRPVHPAVVGIAALAVAALAVAGTVRAVDSPNTRRAAAQRTASPSPSPTPTGNVVEFGSGVTGLPVDPGDGLDLLLVGGGSVGTLRTTDGAERVLAALPDGVVERLVPLRHGFAILVDGALVVWDDGEQTRTPLPPPGYLVEGENDTEFWTVADGVAQRHDAHGHALGTAVRVPYDISVVRGVAGGRLLAYNDPAGTSLVVWDPATRRVVRDLGDLGEVRATGPRHVVTGFYCSDGPCPFRVTNVVTGTSTTTITPDEEGEMGPVALLDGRTFAFVWTFGGESYLFTGDGGGRSPRLLTRGLPRDVRLHWVSPRRLALLQLADGRMTVLVADPVTGQVRQAGSYGAREVDQFYARPANS